MTDDVEHGGWVCPAYGPEGARFGSVCYFTSERGRRKCATGQVCAESLAAERQRAWQRIQRRAAVGDPVALLLAEHFTDPEHLIGGALATPVGSLRDDTNHDET